MFNKEADINVDVLKSKIEKACDAKQVSKEARELATQAFAMFAVADISVKALARIPGYEKNDGRDVVAFTVAWMAKAIDDLVDKEVDEALQDDEDDEDDGFTPPATVNAAPVLPNPLWGSTTGDEYPLENCDCTACEVARKNADYFRPMSFPNRPMYPTKPITFYENW